MVDSTILVMGQIGRDLILTVEQFPGAGGSVDVGTRHEILGGKGVNQAVGMVQLGAPVTLLGVTGADPAGEGLLRSLRDDGIGAEWVVRRGVSALLLDVVDADGERRLLEHVPDESLLGVDDVRGAEEAFRAADTVCLQLQQPAATLLEAARLAVDAGARVVLDGAVTDPEKQGLLSAASVVRADAHEAQLLTGVAMRDSGAAVNTARSLIDGGVEVVAFGVEGVGDIVAWDGGHRFFPFGQGKADVTGGGDAFLAGLVVGLRAGCAPGEAGELAAACRDSAVQRLGGRPDLTGLAPTNSRVG
ncbi:PfkB family carbohydrate kinase [Corynebacterium halotolerans]|uniref:Kinase, PfkB family protein n=1 Tax=Corynebacterium halotolerans YIM 70093 = DSM 44683 TaxID=1121362 RepID=M1P4D4_9CORY|nr:PfkB family carbohydrate kinase [Corynebacterium halotolerans]AGF71481.1 kinase, PfkB family protein [Corynebacterium halotolerans YIM 70093 = DSM 44683]